eukprot:9477482-Pyramimonas_sp.AAC.1
MAGSRVGLAVWRSARVRAPLVVRGPERCAPIADTLVTCRTTGKARHQRGQGDYRHADRCDHNDPSGHLWYRSPERCAPFGPTSIKLYEPLGTPAIRGQGDYLHADRCDRYDPSGHL